MLRGGLVLIWELHMNLVPTLIAKSMIIENLIILTVGPFTK